MYPVTGNYAIPSYACNVMTHDVNGDKHESVQAADAGVSLTDCSLSFSSFRKTASMCEHWDLMVIMGS